jgi:polyhydroxyalkanoate synthesis regulator phasin
MKGALERAQTAASGARERLDFVNQSELEALQEAVEELKQRVGALEAKAFGASEEEGTGP